MFGRRFGWSHPHRHEGPWHGGPPPWGPHFGRSRRHGPDDEPWQGPPFGRRFGGFGPPSERFFGRGDLKYVILDLLQDQPRHGYDVIRALEERFRGFYSPSPGSVYPTLQLLADQGYLTSTERDGKRVYAITDEGRRFLAEQADVVEGLRARMGAGRGFRGNPETGELLQEVRQLGQVLFRQGARGALHDPEKVRRLREVVARARREIETIFADGPTEPPATL